MLSLPGKVVSHFGNISHSQGRQFYSVCRSLQQQQCQIQGKQSLVRLSQTLQKNCLLSRNVSTTSTVHGQQTFELTAGPFGNLTLQSNGAVNTTIKYLDPQAYPLQNKVLVNVQSDDSVELTADDVKLEQDENEIKLILKGCKNGQPISCLANLPIKFDIDACTSDSGNISIEKFENDSISIQTESGTCRLKNIQTGTATVVSNGGDVIVDGVLQGNSSIKAMGASNVKLHRIQGLTCQVETDSGNIEAKAVYADNSNFVTSSGDIHLGSGHRNCTVEATTSGNIRIDSLDGDLCAKTNRGDVNVAYVARHETIDISTQKGDIDIKLSDSMKTNVNIEGSAVDISEDLDVVDERKVTSAERIYLKGILLGGSAVDVKNADILGELQRRLTAKTGHGNVKLSSTDWFTSLKLMKNVD